MKYSIAYGRNLDLNKMKEKCPHAKLLGKAVLKDWQLSFGYWITIEPQKGSHVPVGIWEVDEIGEMELDIIEDFPNMYRKEYVDIEFNGKWIKAMAYIINNVTPRPLTKEYVNKLKIGYKDFNYDFKYIEDALKRNKVKIID